MGGPDANKVAAVVEEMNDAKGNAKKTAGLFATGTKPPEMKKIALYDFSVARKPAVTGDTANCKVRLDKAANGEQAGEVEWEFVKEGDKWKIKAAPLP